MQVNFFSCLAILFAILAGITERSIVRTAGIYTLEESPEKTDNFGSLLNSHKYCKRTFLMGIYSVKNKFTPF